MHTKEITFTYPEAGIAHSPLGPELPPTDAMVVTGLYFAAKGGGLTGGSKGGMRQTEVGRP
jgi:hypothetical protein